MWAPRPARPRPPSPPSPPPPGRALTRATAIDPDLGVLSVTWTRSELGGRRRIWGEQSRDAHIVAASGEVDATTAPTLTAGLAWVADEVEGVVIDLCAVRFMDTAGVHALVEGDQLLTARGHRVVVACTPLGPVARILEITAASALVAIEGSCALAVERALA